MSGDGIHGGYDTARIITDTDTTERDQTAVLNVCAIAAASGDDDGTVRTELLGALGLHPLAIAMRDGTELPTRRRPLAARRPVEQVTDDPYAELPSKTVKAAPRPLYMRPGMDAKHGTRNGYTNYGCRCESCTAANAAYTRQRKANLTGQSS